VRSTDPLFADTAGEELELLPDFSELQAVATSDAIARATTVGFFKNAPFEE
jgi:hypothetical protein